MRRIKRLLVSPYFLEALLKALDGKTLLTVKGLPENARIIGVTQDWQSNMLCLFIESPSFDEIPDAAIPPDLHIEFTRTLIASEVA